jgi:tellurite resistance-related uncharacterized protein
MALEAWVAGDLRHDSHYAGALAAVRSTRYAVDSMMRAITGYHRDAAGDWVAELACRHGQHVRHKPPFLVREWVTTDEGRRSMLGTRLDCVRCDRLEMPDGLLAYSTTKSFDAASVPESLRTRHATKEGVWALVHVASGRLRYVVDALDGTVFELDPEHPGVIAPAMLHHVEPIGPVVFHVEFFR